MGKMSNKEKAQIRETIGVDPGAAWGKATPNTKKGGWGSVTKAHFDEMVDVAGTIEKEAKTQVSDRAANHAVKQQNSDEDSKVAVAKSLFNKNYEDLSDDEEATVVRAVQTATGIAKRFKDANDPLSYSNIPDLVNAAFSISPWKISETMKKGDIKTVRKAAGAGSR